MSDDAFSKQAGKAFQGVVISAAGLVGGLPGVALTAGVSGVLNVFDALLSRNTEAFNEARFGALEDEVQRVADEVRKINEARIADGKAPEAPDPIAQGVLFSDFAESVASAATPEKRTALVHAAAHQFDPDWGTLPIRNYWFNEVRRLGDMEVAVIKLLHEQAHVVFSGNDTLGYGGDPNGKPKRIELAFAERVAIENTVTRLHQAGEARSYRPRNTRRRNALRSDLDGPRYRAFHE